MPSAVTDMIGRDSGLATLRRPSHQQARVLHLWRAQVVAELGLVDGQLAKHSGHGRFGWPRATLS